MIADIITKLHYSEHYNISDAVEIAKGKNELVYTWEGFKRKLKRRWLRKE